MLITADDGVDGDDIHEPTNSQLAPWRAINVKPAKEKLHLAAIAFVAAMCGHGAAACRRLPRNQQGPLEHLSSVLPPADGPGTTTHVL